MSRSNKVRILIVDDHELFRQGLASLIADDPDMEIIAQAGDGLRATALARELEPDLIIMDVNMPISTGLEATRLIRHFNPQARILMLTIRDEDETLFEAIRAGASGYLLKDADWATFQDAVQRIMNGDVVLPPKLATRLLTEFARLSRQPEATAPPTQEYGLTSRELEVLRQVAVGATDKEIAAHLHLSVYTVKSHVRNILGKLHAANRWEAARLAGNHRLLDDSSSKN